MEVHCYISANTARNGLKRVPHRNLHPLLYRLNPPMVQAQSTAYLPTNGRQHMLRGPYGAEQAYQRTVPSSLEVLSGAHLYPTPRRTDGAGWMLAEGQMSSGVVPVVPLSSFYARPLSLNIRGGRRAPPAFGPLPNYLQQGGGGMGMGGISSGEDMMGPAMASPPPFGTMMGAGGEMGDENMAMGGGGDFMNGGGMEANNGFGPQIPSLNNAAAGILSQGSAAGFGSPIRNVFNQQQAQAPLAMIPKQQRQTTDSGGCYGMDDCPGGDMGGDGMMDGGGMMDGDNGGMLGGMVGGDGMGSMMGGGGGMSDGRMNPAGSMPTAPYSAGAPNRNPYVRGMNVGAGGGSMLRGMVGGGIGMEDGMMSGGGMPSMFGGGFGSGGGGGDIGMMGGVDPYDAMGGGGGDGAGMMEEGGDFVGPEMFGGMPSDQMMSNVGGGGQGFYQQNNNGLIQPTAGMAGVQAPPTGSLQPRPNTDNNNNDNNNMRKYAEYLELINKKYGIGMPGTGTAPPTPFSGGNQVMGVAGQQQQIYLPQPPLPPPPPLPVTYPRAAVIPPFLQPHPQPQQQQMIAAIEPPPAMPDQTSSNRVVDDGQVPFYRNNFNVHSIQPPPVVYTIQGPPPSVLTNYVHTSVPNSVGGFPKNKNDRDNDDGGGRTAETPGDNAENGKQQSTGRLVVTAGGAREDADSGTDNSNDNNDPNTGKEGSGTNNKSGYGSNTGKTSGREVDDTFTPRPPFFSRQSTTSIQALTQQIRRLPAVFYIDSRNENSRRMEQTLRETYGLPLVSFYVDKIDDPLAVERNLQQLTAHKGLPYLFICGTFIGSQEHIENYHSQKQVSQLVEYVCGESRDSADARKQRRRRKKKKKQYRGPN